MWLLDLLTAARRVNRDPDIGDAEWIDYANETLRAAAKAVFLPDLEAAASVSVPAGVTSVALPEDYQRYLFRAINADGAWLAIAESSQELRGPWELFENQGGIRRVATVGGRLLVWPAPEEEELLHIGYFRLPHTLEIVSGTVSFAAEGNSLTATTSERLFARFHAGDVFVVSGSLANNAAFTVERVSETDCVVSETVSDENAAKVGLLARAVEGIPEELQRAVLVNGMLARAYDTGEDAVEGKPNTDRYMTLAAQALRDLKVAINLTGYRPPRVDSETAKIKALA